MIPALSDRAPFERFTRRIRDLPASPAATRALGRPGASRLTRNAAGGLASARHVLVVRLDAIGDFVLTTPFLRALRHALPDARIALVVRPNVEPLARTCPYVDEVLTLEVETGPWALRGFTRQWAALRLCRHALAAPPDVALSPRWGADGYHAAQLMYLSGAGERIGFAAAARPAGTESLLTRALEGPALLHERRRPLDMLEQLGLRTGSDHTELWIEPAAEAWAKARLGEAEPGTVRIALAPGSREARKRWPGQRFAEAVSGLGAQRRAEVVLLGGHAELGLSASIASRLEVPTHDLTGRLDLARSLACLATCDLLLSNDSGPLHLSDALGVPLVGVSCHSLGGDPHSVFSPERFGPSGERARLVRPEKPRSPSCTAECSQDEAHCILGVTVEAVVETAAALLRTSAG